MSKTTADYPVGTQITAIVGPTKVKLTAKVTGHDGQFLVTEDASGKTRKVRPGSVI